MLIRSDGLGAPKAMEELEGKDGRIDRRALIAMNVLRK